MTPVQRSTLRLDLKDLAPRPSTPHIGRLGLIAISVIAVVSAVISINSPSASVANMDIRSVNGVDRAINDNDMGDVTRDGAAASVATVAATLEQLDAEKEHRPDHDRGLLTLDSRSRIDIPGILDSGPDTVEQAPDQRRTRLHVASLAPVIPRESFAPLVNLIEEEPEPALSRPAETQSVQPVVPEPDLAIGVDGATESTPVELASIDPSPAGGFSTAVSQEPDAPVAPRDPLQEALSEGEWKTEVVRKKDTVSQLFNRLGISSREAYTLVEQDGAERLNTIRPGEEISVTTTPLEEGGDKVRLEKLKYKVDQFTTLLVRSDGESYTTDLIEREPEVRHRTVRATIWDSLLGAAKTADIPFDVVHSLATIFGWQVDFARDIHSGDSFTAIYEELYLDDELIDSGQVVAAELVTGERNLRAVRHVDEEDHVTYYAPDGEGIQGSFLRSPIKFARVTSNFSKRRLHPIKKIWKAHKGVDYGAPMNTPIRSTGDGVVKFVGTKKGYGKTVVLRHGEKYTTLYAHMNKFRKGLRSGSRVKQGDVIGYVGRTGWATGPHLHYEFRVAGNHVDPLTVELPKSLPIDNRYRETFREDASIWVAELERVGRIPLARNER